MPLSKAIKMHGRRRKDEFHGTNSKKALRHHQKTEISMMQIMNTALAHLTVKLSNYDFHLVYEITFEVI